MNKYHFTDCSLQANLFVGASVAAVTNIKLVNFFFLDFFIDFTPISKEQVKKKETKH